MGILNALKGFSAGLASDDEATGPSKALHIVDMRKMAAGNGGRERLSPRDRFVLLQKVAGFFEREKLRACVVLEGRPLREAPEGSTYKTVQVHYGESDQQVSDQVLELGRKSRGGCTIITQKRELESEALKQGWHTLRISTLRKAIEDGGGRSGGGRGRRRQGPRSQKSSGPQGGRGGRGRRGNRKPESESPNTEKSADQGGASPDADGVSDLIDLV